VNGIYSYNIFVLNGVQHAFFNNTKKIAEFCIMFDEFVGKVREKMDNEYLIAHCFRPWTA